MSFTRNGQTIRTLDEWEKIAGPKRDDQWSPDRSAMEVARAWLSVASPILPADVAAALASNPAFGTVTRWTGEPEVRLSFDKLRGEPRNSDLLVRGHDEYGKFLLAVEAKADESFGETVADALADAVERRLVNPGSRGVERIQGLAAALLEPKRRGEARLGRLRYQLLTAVAGAVAVAVKEGGCRVVFLVHEFRTSKTVDKKHATNARDLDEFVHRLTHGAVPHIEAGTVRGPIQLRPSALFDTIPPLFIGKVASDLRSGAREPAEMIASRDHPGAVSGEPSRRGPGQESDPA